MTSWLTPTFLFILLNIMIGTIFLISRLSPPKTPHHQQFGYNSAPPLQRAPSLLDRVKSINFSTYKFPFSNQDFDHHLQPADSLAANPLERAPSILERVKSIDFSFYKNSPQNPETGYIQPTEHDYTNPQPLGRAPSLLERVKSIDFTSFYRSDSVKSNQPTEPLVTEEADSDTDMSPVHGQVKRIQSESKIRQRKLPENMKKSASENSRRKAEEEEEEEEVERRRPATTRIEKTVSLGDGDQSVDAKADDFIYNFKKQLRLQRLDSLLRYRDMLKGK
ncbi:uncharacterized protein LOC111302582 [Durio zibethinus]|uniref:Uncharacterized protein LOC111302582 n=1 Tax=Durio zibethinus TaxID=66656 RepID=A0A6P5ZMW1_DURZI|nr:uncharacterized protein LOC111302582 [Durio zibethinus]